MRVVVAPDSFTGSLSARAAAAAFAAGWRSARPGDDIVEVPVADGGEGTVDVLARLPGALRRTATAADPLGRPVDTEWLLLADGTAVVEMATASGLGRLGAAERDPLRTSSRGTGDLIRSALDAGARRVVVGLGGSATNDGGAGCLAALGARLVDVAGRPLAEGGGALAAVSAVDLDGLDPRLTHTEVVAATDVTSPLVGPEGASAVFGPQKGATAGDVATLDAALARWADVLAAATGRTDLADLPGGGAAGGLGVGLVAGVGARIEPGAQFVLGLLSLADAIAGADLVVTGEGSVDRQTLRGKAPGAVAQLAATAGVPCVAVGGVVRAGRQELAAAGFDAAYAVVDLAPSPEAAVADAASWLSELGAVVAREWSRRGPDGNDRPGPAR